MRVVKPGKTPGFTVLYAKAPDQGWATSFSWCLVNLIIWYRVCVGQDSGVQLGLVWVCIKPWEHFTVPLKASFQISSQSPVWYIETKSLWVIVKWKSKQKFRMRNIFWKYWRQNLNYFLFQPDITKYHRLGGIKQRNLFFTGLESRSLRLWCWHGWFHPIWMTSLATKDAQYMYLLLNTIPSNNSFLISYSICNNFPLVITHFWSI